MKIARRSLGGPHVVGLGMIGVLVAAALVPAGSEGQSLSRLLGQQVAWDVILDGPTHEVSGIVLIEDGAPREDAIVRIDGVEGGVLTDAEGRFLLVVPGAGEWVIRIAQIGASPVEQPFVLPRGASVRMVAYMPDQVVPLCSLYVCGRDGFRDLEMEVSDPETGRSPEGEGTVRLEHESGTITHTAQIDSTVPGSQRVGIGQEVVTEGFHTIDVMVPGYRPWRRERVWLELTDECHPRLMGAPREVRLERLEL